MTGYFIEGTHRAYRYVVTWADEEDGLRWRAKVFLGDELKCRPKRLHTGNKPLEKAWAEALIRLWIDRNLF